MIDLYVDGVKVESLTGLELNNILLGLHHRQLKLNKESHEMAHANLNLIHRLSKIEKLHIEQMCDAVRNYRNESFWSSELTDEQRRAVIMALALLAFSGPNHCTEDNNE